MRLQENEEQGTSKASFSVCERFVSVLPHSYLVNQ